MSESVPALRGREAYRGIACTWHRSARDQSGGEDFHVVAVVGTQPPVRRILRALSHMTLVLRQ